MFSIASHIEYLLMSHHCVVAPGLGAFLVHESPAFYDESTGLFMPPSRSIGFNQAVTLNDGLLAGSLARKEKISIENAHAKVETAIASFRRQLEEASVLPFGNLGEISVSEGKIIFEPSTTSAVSISNFGLTPLALCPLHDETTPDQSDATHSRSESTVLRLTLRIAASLIIVLLACGIFFTTGNLLGDRAVNQASLDSGLRHNIASTMPAPTVVKELPVSREIQLNIAIPSVTSDSKSEIHTDVNATDGHSQPGRYLLVVGSLPTLNAAKRQVGNDTSLRILEMDGRFRIYAGSAATLAEATRLVESVREGFPSVWICRR